MILDEIKKMIDKARNYDQVVIVGAGKTFINLLGLLNKNGINVKEAFDNNEDLIGSIFNGVRVVRPYKCLSNTLYIIDSKSDRVAEEQKKQLEAIGIESDSIIRQPHVSQNEIDITDENSLKYVIDQLYCERFGEYINWDNPETYNELINWEKVFDRDIRKKELADKYLVRRFIKEKIGEQYLIKLLGHWDNVDQIDFEVLPEKFVLKTNNGSGRNIIVTDKQNLDIKWVKETLSKWMESDYWRGLYEFQYKDIPPIIICEEYLKEVGDDANEFKFYCFNGKVRYIGCERNSHKPGWCGAIYDIDWNRQDFGYAVPIDLKERKRPDKLEEMIRVSEILSEGFRHVRVDLYEFPNGKVLFGELTFSSWGGMKHFTPERFDEVFGKMARD